MNDTVLITALYDINRHKYNNQELALKTLDDYLPWFKITLQLNCDMIIYTEEKIKDFIIQHRPKKYKTKIIVTKLKDVPYYKYKYRIETVLKSSDYKSKMKDLNRIECNLPEYTIIQYSKFEWLRNAIDINPFDNKYFFWIDAGCSRFFENFNLQNQFPGPKTSELLKNIEDKFFCQTRLDINRTIKIPNFFYTSHNLIYGTLFGGNKNIISFMADSVKYVFEDLLKKNIVNNEQLVLAYIYDKCPNNFHIYMNTTNTHLPFFLRLCN